VAQERIKVEQAGARESTGGKGRLTMGTDPWTDPDPQHGGNPDAKLSVIVSVEGDDAKLS
jgi:hypothetical protein